ncbi:MAG: hypothetical protein WC313_11250, partial [Candidatus Kapaibacterium sp.]
MSTFELTKLKSLLNVQEKIQPKTYIDELAESGLLDDYLEVFFRHKLSSDEDFKDRIYNAYYKYADSANENLEFYYLESICESLSFFIEYTET